MSAEEPANLKISEVARRAGVSVPTIHFYMREGVLPPPPRKTSRNMAYYDESFVARIKLVRRLQKERRLSLKAIRALLNDGVADSDEAVLALVELRAKGFYTRDGGPGVTRRELLGETGVDKVDLEGLEELGIVAAQGSGSRRRYSAHDVAIAAVVAKARHIGLDRELFPVADLALYRRTIHELVSEEARLFAERMRGQETRFSSQELLEAVVELTGEMIVHLRRKLIAELTSGLDLDDA